DEDYLTSRLRGVILSCAGRSGHEATVKEAKRRFALFMAADTTEQDKILHPTARKMAFEVAISQGGVTEFDQVMAYYQNTPKQDQQSMCLMAMGAAVRGQELIQRIFDFALSEQVRSQDFPYMLADTKEFERDLEQAKEGLRIRGKWVARDGAALESWLVEQGY
ncbi:hypothetical protein BGZ92_008961, partial [Podila epicladia]